MINRCKQSDLFSAPVISGGGTAGQSDNKRERIKSLEGLRAFAFLCVVFCHTGLAKDSFHYVGHMAVSLFFILSGFVSVYGQIDRTDFKPSFLYNFKYLIARLKKIYALFVLTTLFFAIFDILGENASSIDSVIIRIGLNLTLLQEWFPLKLRTYNGPAWFLGTITLFYFVFPCILKNIQNNCNLKKARNRILILVLIEAFIAVVSLYLPRPVYSENMILEYNIVYWFVYCFPIARIVDCLIGCYLGYLFIANIDKKVNLVTIKEFIALSLCIISSVIASMMAPVTSTSSVAPIIDYTYGWSLALLFLPGTISIIYLFAFNQGKISRFFENKFFMYLAVISPYGFLIQMVIFECLGKVAWHIVAKGNGEVFRLFDAHYLGWIKLTAGLFFTLVSCQIWIYFKIKGVEHWATAKEK